MSTDAMHKVVRLDENELQELTLEVKEILANGTEYRKNAKENFTRVNMWNVLRQSRSASSMIRKWNN
jgi:hypothetical protein